MKSILEVVEQKEAELKRYQDAILRIKEELIALAKVIPMLLEPSDPKPKMTTLP